MFSGWDPHVRWIQLDQPAMDVQKYIFLFHFFSYKNFNQNKGFAYSRLTNQDLGDKRGAELLEPKKTPLNHKEIKIRLIQIYANEHYLC